MKLLKYVVFLGLILESCVNPQVELSYDLQSKAIKTCDNRVIREVLIEKKELEGNYVKEGLLRLKEGEEGKSIIILKGENPEYLTVIPFKGFLENATYRISVPNFDNVGELLIKTNEKGAVVESSNQCF